MPQWDEVWIAGHIQGLTEYRVYLSLSNQTIILIRARSRVKPWSWCGCPAGTPWSPSPASRSSRGPRGGPGGRPASARRGGCVGRTRRAMWHARDRNAIQALLIFFYPLSTVVLSAALIIVGGFRPRLDIVVVIVVRSVALPCAFTSSAKVGLKERGDSGGPFRAPLLPPLSSYSADSSRRCQFVKCSNSAEWLFYGFKITLIGLNKKRLDERGMRQSVALTKSLAHKIPRSIWRI